MLLPYKHVHVILAFVVFLILTVLGNDISNDDPDAILENFVSKVNDSRLVTEFFTTELY